MALTETLTLDISGAQRQIDALNAQLDQLSQPLNVPVTVTGEGSLDRVTTDLTQSENAVEELNRELDETEASLRGAGTAAKNTGDDLERAGRKGKSSFDNLSGSVKGLFAAFGGAIVIREFVQFAGGAIDAASDLEESTSKAQVVFGSFFEDIQAFAQTAPQSLGLANQQALEFTATFGNLFVALGLSQQAAAELSPEIVRLGSDLASFNNIEVGEALDKLRAGLVGEAEPLRVLGVNLTAAATAAKAVELGLAASTNEVSEAAKVQARYALILEQTATAQGDFARTSDSIANQQKTLAAEFDGLRVAIGQALLPAFQALLDVAPSLIQLVEDGLVPAFASLGSAIDDVDTEGLSRTLAGLPSAIGTAFSQIGAGTQAVGNAVQIFGALARLDFSDVGDQFGQLNDDIQRLRESGPANAAIQNLLTTIASGAEPVAALESVLVELGQNVSSLTLETFEALVTQLQVLATAAGATPEELFRLAAVVEEVGQAAGFSAPGVAILADELRGPWAQAMAEASSGDIIAANLAASIVDLGDAAGEAGPEVEGFRLSLGRLNQIGTEADFSDISGFFDQLPTELDAAATAMRDTEGEIETDLTAFLTRLQEELTAQAAFADNLETLRGLGLDALADAFATEGIDSAPLVADAIANPLESAEAEAALDAAAAANAIRYLDEFSASIESEFGALGLEFEIPVTPVLQPLNTANFAIPTELIARIGVSGNSPGGATQITQNFYETPTPTTETERAGQAINSIVSNAR